MLRASRGEGLGKSGKANASEPLINAVNATEPKALTGSSQKGEQPRGAGGGQCPAVDHRAAGGKEGPTPLMRHVRNRVSPYVSDHIGRDAVRRTNGRAGSGMRRKRRPGCNGRDTD